MGVIMLGGKLRRTVIDEPKPVKEKRERKPSEIRNLASWANVRRRIMDRDGWQCRICHQDAAEASLNVHHIDYNRANNRGENLVTLCVKCHRAVHAEGYKPSLYEDWPVPWGDHA